MENEKEKVTNNELQVNNVPVTDESGTQPIPEESPAETAISNEPEVPEEVTQPEVAAEPAQHEQPEQPTEPQQDASIVMGGSEGPTQPVGPKRRFHLTKKAALIGLGALLIVGGAGAYAYKAIFMKTKPVSHFSAVVVEPFKVVSSSPLPDASGVGADSKITLTFNRPVDPAKMKGDFFVSPQTDGTFTQGSSPEQVVFTPAVQFKQGTKVQFMLHGEFTAKNGAKLGADYIGKFTTAIPGTGFNFVRQNEFLDLDSLPTGTKATYQITTGDDIKSGNTVTIYKSDVNQLLRSFVYQSQTDSYGNTLPSLTGTTVSTSGLSVVSTKANVSNGGSIDFNAGPGVYLAVAVNGGKQVGRMWLVVSDYGVLLRQDDQNAVVALQKLDDGSSASGSVNFYSLDKGVSSLTTKQISGEATVSLGFKPRLDIAVAQVGGQVQVVPVAQLNSLADIRSMTNLSTKPIAFGTTDKPSYKPGEVVHFAGYLRTDNDAAYTAYSGSSVKLYVATDPGGTHLADTTAVVAGDGTFKGSFTTASSFITAGTTKTQLHLYVVGNPSGVVGYGVADADVASFTTTNEAAGQYAFKVSFAKNEYLPQDKVTATIVGVKADGSPLANTSVNVDTYSRPYVEGEIDQTTYTGDQVNKSPVSVTLDAQGKGSYTTDVSKLPSGSSQVVTVVASKQQDANTKVAGSAQAIVHQGNAVLQFGSSRTTIKPNTPLVARVYAKTLNGSPIGNASIDYTVTVSTYNSATQQMDTKQLASGTVTADGSGYATINQSLSNVPQSGSITLTVSTGDSQNNKVQNQHYYYVDDGSGNTAYSDIQLAGLDVYGSPTDVQVGDTLHLTVDAPQAVHALMSMERGRVYNSQVVDLHAGKNDVTVQVTQQMLPSFNLVFSYFSGGQYHVDGVPYNVTAEANQATVSFNSSGINAKAGSTFNLPLNVTNSGNNGIPTRVIFSASESSMFNSASPLTSPIFAHLYAPLEITTNSSSSLTGIGSGGGKCGGGMGDLPDYIQPSGSVGSWQPDLSTDAGGKANIPLNLPKGRWHLTAYAMSQDNIVGNTSTDITVN